MTASQPAFSGAKRRKLQNIRRSRTKKFTKGASLLEKTAQKSTDYKQNYYYYFFVFPPFILQKG